MTYTIKGDKFDFRDFYNLSDQFDKANGDVDQFLFIGDRMYRQIWTALKNIGAGGMRYSRIIIDDTDFKNVESILFGKYSLFIIPCEVFDHPATFKNFPHNDIIAIDRKNLQKYVSELKAISETVNN